MFSRSALKKYSKPYSKKWRAVIIYSIPIITTLQQLNHLAGQLDTILHFYFPKVFLGFMNSKCFFVNEYDNLE